MPDQAAPAPFSVVVPVFDEAAALPRTVPALLDGLPSGVELVFVCNGCSDGSAAVIRALAGGRALVVETGRRGKALAIRLGETRTGVLPRFFVDADVEVRGEALAAMAARLSGGGCELVSPRLRHDASASGWAVRAAVEAWGRTPYAAGEAFQAVLGVSARARARWGEFPDLICDDGFVASRVARDRRLVDRRFEAVARAPRTFRSFVRVSTRAEAGLAQLAATGCARPRTPGQRRALLRMVASGPNRLGAAAYLFAKLAARARCRLGPGVAGWYTDATSR